MSDALAGGDALREEITHLRSEVLEQARLLDMSAEREARLRARVEELWGKWSLVRREEARLLARVEVLREPLAVYVHAHQTGNSVPPHIEAAARAALKGATP